MLPYIGAILIVVGLVVITFILWNVKKHPRMDSTDEEDQQRIQFAQSIIEGLPEQDDISSVLLAEEPILVKLSKGFDILLAANRIPAAERIAKLIIEIDQDSPAGHMRLGLTAMRRGNFEKAKDEFKIALDNDLGLIRALNNLSYILNYQKRFAETIELMEPYTASIMDNTVSTVNLAIAYYHEEKPRKAYWLLNSAYKQEPRIPEIHLYMGHCLKKLGENEKAKLAYKRYKILVSEVEKSGIEQEIIETQEESLAGSLESSPESKTIKSDEDESPSADDLLEFMK